MRFRILCTVFLSSLLILLSFGSGYSQLLEDRNKLKTEKGKKGFSLYKKKVIKRSPSGEQQTDDKTVSPKYSQTRGLSKKERKVQPKYSRDTRAKRFFRAITPRYSQENAGQSSDREVTPRYSKRKQKGKITIISPKYSQQVAGQGSDRIVNPKYSRQRAGQGSDRAVSPKYSIQRAGQGSDRLVNPKYSQQIAGQGSDRIVQPRYSKQRAGQGYNKIVSPRYSKYVAGQGMDRVVNPKYSRDIAGQGYNKTVNPRYSKYVAGQGMDRVVNPRFSVNPLYVYKYIKPRSASGSMVFSTPRIAHYIKRKKNRGEEDWNGPWIKIQDHKRPEFASYTGKIKKQKKGRHMHPSSNYLFAKHNNSELARDLMQKASILWVRVHMNQTDPKSVRKKTPKLKFDKDEAEIWNNKEREYTKN